MAAKWRRRSDQPGGVPAATVGTGMPAPRGGGKRADHPSPAYGSPAAEMMGQEKRMNNQASPAWLGNGLGAPTDPLLAGAAGNADAVSELLAQNQRSFAARFAGGNPTATLPDSNAATLLNGGTSTTAGLTGTAGLAGTPGVGGVPAPGLGLSQTAGLAPGLAPAGLAGAPVATTQGLLGTSGLVGTAGLAAPASLAGPTNFAATQPSLAGLGLANASTSSTGTASLLAGTAGLAGLSGSGLAGATGVPGVGASAGFTAASMGLAGLPATTPGLATTTGLNSASLASLGLTQMQAPAPVAVQQPVAAQQQPMVGVSTAMAPVTAASMAAATVATLTPQQQAYINNAQNTALLQGTGAGTTNALLQHLAATSGFSTAALSTNAAASVAMTTTAADPAAAAAVAAAAAAATTFPLNPTTLQVNNSAVITSVPGLQSIQLGATAAATTPGLAVPGSVPTPLQASAALSAAAAAGVSAQLGVPPGGVAAAAAGANPNKRRSSSKKQQQPKPGGGGRWTKEEDQKLRAAVAAVGPQNWKMIASDYLGDQRSDVQCLHRWQKVLQPGLVKGPWTKEEDQIIIDCIEAGITKWSEIAERIPGRIGKQCRERWFNHLDPSLKKGGWTEEEDAVLVEAQSKWGNSWTKIAKLLPGRSENAVKNRWNSATRRRQKAQQRTAEKLAQEAAAKVQAADNAEREAEAQRVEGAANGGANGSRLLNAEEDDTECVPKSAIALLRARRAAEGTTGPLNLDPDGSTSPITVPPVPPIVGNPGAITVTSTGQLTTVGEQQAAASTPPLDAMDTDNSTVGTLAAMRERANNTTSTKSGGRNKLASLGPGAPHVRDSENNENLPKAPQPGLGASAPPPDLFNDSTLTEREKELIHRAYLAGIAQSNQSNSSRDPMKLKLRRDMNGSISKSDQENASPVQWDFQSETQPTPNVTGAAIPVDFLREHGIEFDLTEMENSSEGVPHISAPESGGSRHEHNDGIDDDLELSSSLLTMSLDKDIPMDEMALSAGERGLLSKPIASDAMAAIVGAGFGAGRTIGTMDLGDSQDSNSSPSGPLPASPGSAATAGLAFGMDTATSPGSSGEPMRPPAVVTSNVAAAHAAVSAGGSGLLGVGANNMSPTASMLHQLGDAYRDGLISEEQKQELKRNLVSHAAAQQQSPRAAVAAKTAATATAAPAVAPAPTMSAAMAATLTAPVTATVATTAAAQLAQQQALAQQQLQQQQILQQAAQLQQLAAQQQAQQAVAAQAGQPLQQAQAQALLSSQLSQLTQLNQFNQLAASNGVKLESGTTGVASELAGVDLASAGMLWGNLAGAS